MVNEEQVIRSLIHEYTHSTQDHYDSKEHRKLGYDNDPREIEAHKNENDWKKFV